MAEDDDLSAIFQAGAAAHIANHGFGRWLNPYVSLLGQIQQTQESLDDIYRKVDAWDAGWLCQTRKEAEKISPGSGLAQQE